MDERDLNALARQHLAEERADASRTLCSEPRPMRLALPPGGRCPESERWRARGRLASGTYVLDPLRCYASWLVTVDAAPLSIVDASPTQPRHGYAHDRITRAYSEGAFDGLLTDVAGLARRRELEVTAPGRAAFLEERVIALVARFPELLLEARSLDDGWLLDFASAEIRDAVVLGAPYHGAHLAGVGEASVYLRTTSRVSQRAAGRIVDALRGVLKWIEAHPNEAPPPWQDLPGLHAPDRHGAEPRYRTVLPHEVDETLAMVVDLESRVYEPARRDSPEKLGLALHDPDGVAIVAEIERAPGEWSLIGFALGAPLERIKETPGADIDPMRGLHNTIYALSLATDPSYHGVGLGRVLKEKLLEEAGKRLRPDGTPRYVFCSGRQRVGAAEAMMRINQALGGFEVFLLERQYDGTAQAWYYRQPVRTFEIVSVRSRERLTTSLTLGAPLVEPPATLAELYRLGGLYGPIVHALRLGRRVTPAAIRAVEWIAALDPERPRLRFFSTLDEALSSLRGPRLSLEGTEIGLDTVAHDDAPASSRCTLVVEPLSARDGRALPEGFLDRLPDHVEIVGLDRASSLYRTGRFGAPLPARASRLWCAPGFVCLQEAGEPSVELHDVDEYALVFAHHLLRDWHGRPIDAGEAARAVGSIPGEHRGAGLYRVVETDDATRWAAALARRGYELDHDERTLRFAFPLDFGARYGALGEAITDALGELTT